MNETGRQAEIITDHLATRSVVQVSWWRGNCIEAQTAHEADGSAPVGALGATSTHAWRKDKRQLMREPSTAADIHRSSLQGPDPSSNVDLAKGQNRNGPSSECPKRLFL